MTVREGQHQEDWGMNDGGQRLKRHDRIAISQSATLIFLSLLVSEDVEKLHSKQFDPLMLITNIRITYMWIIYPNSENVG